jgi:uncharacterized protein YjeT (DUF2065 family)
MWPKVLAWLASVLPGVAKWAAASRAHAAEALQVAGVGTVVAGVYVLWHLGVALLVGGVLAVGLGVLFEREAG